MYKLIHVIALLTILNFNNYIEATPDRPDDENSSQMSESEDDDPEEEQEEPVIPVEVSKPNPPLGEDLDSQPKGQGSIEEEPPLQTIAAQELIEPVPVQNIPNELILNEIIQQEFSEKKENTEEVIEAAFISDNNIEFTSELIDCRLDNLIIHNKKIPISGGSRKLSLGSWASLSFTKAKQEKNLDNKGYNINTKIFSLGIDGEILDDLVLGFVYNNINSKLSYFDDKENKLKQDMFLSYFHISFDEKAILESQLGVGNSSLSSDKEIKGDMIFLRLSVKKSFNLLKNISLIPKFGVEYFEIDYSEGKKDLLLLEGLKYKINRMSLNPSFALKNNIDFKDFCLSTEMHLGFDYKINGQAGKIISGHPSFEVNSKSKASFNIGLNNFWNFNMGEITYGYDFFFRKDFKSHNFHLKARINFN